MIGHKPFSTLARKRKIYALLSAQGTACPETVLYENEYTPENRAMVEESIQPHDPDPPIAGTWTDVSDNDALRE